MRAHRKAWELEVGPIPNGLKVCHKCDNRLCVNVEHLFLGTDRDNINDMKAKGRQVIVRGVSHWAAKLTVDDVHAIRAALSDGVRVVDLARAYSVFPHAIRRIKRGTGWTHV